MNKNVLIYCPSFLPEQTGYSHAFAGLVQNLLDEGFWVDVLVPQEFDGKELMEHPKLRIIRKTYRLKIWLLGLFYQYFCMAQFIFRLNREKKYEVIFIETGDHPLLITFLREQLLHKTVVRFHSASDTEYLVEGKHFKYKTKRWFWKFFAAQRIRNLCATSSYHLNFAKEKIIGHGSFRYEDVITNTVEVPGDFSGNGKSRIFLVLGRMDEEGYKQKAYDILLDALPLVQDRFMQTGSKLIVIGDGLYHEHFREATSGYDFVTLHRSMPHAQVRETLHKSDVVVLPSRYEGVSMFALEALATGNAVIFGNTGGLIPMVKDNGILVEPGDHLVLADGIKKILDTQELPVLKNNSIKLAQQEFSAQKQMEQFYHMIKVIS